MGNYAVVLANGQGHVQRLRLRSSVGRVPPNPSKRAIPGFPCTNLHPFILYRVWVVTNFPLKLWAVEALAAQFGGRRVVGSVSYQ